MQNDFPPQSLSESLLNMTLNHLLLFLLILKLSLADFSFQKLEARSDCSKEGSLQNLMNTLLSHSSKNGFGIQDVGIFEFSVKQENPRIKGLADQIHQCIPANNSVLRFSGSSETPQNQIKSYKRKRLAFTLILSDIKDPVSSRNLPPVVQNFNPRINNNRD
jgi:hypothetical protein